jgi:hypothetical protein
MSQTERAQAPSSLKTYAGGCLCGAVRFEAKMDLTTQPVSRCNCTFCSKVAATSTLVKPDAFRVVAGEELVGEYRKPGSQAARYFCKQCGVHCFGGGYVEEIGGDFRSVYINCLDDVDMSELKVVYWDGRNNNWQAGTRDQPWPLRQARA